MKKNKILIVVDMQNDFINEVLGTKEAVRIVPNVSDRIRTAIKDNEIIYVTRDTHFEDDYMDSEEGKNLPAMHCIKDSHGWQINDEINDALYDSGYEDIHVYNKETFGSISLSAALNTLQYRYDVGEIETIEIIGLCTDICVISNAVIAKAAMPNAHIVVDAACCAGVTPESHDTALKAMKTLQIEVKNEGKEPWK